MGAKHIDSLEQNFLELSESSTEEEYYAANQALHRSIIEYCGTSALLTSMTCFQRSSPL